MEIPPLMGISLLCHLLELGSLTNFLSVSNAIPRMPALRFDIPGLWKMTPKIKRINMAPIYSWAVL